MAEHITVTLSAEAAALLEAIARERGVTAGELQASFALDLAAACGLAG